ncbi:hypothetical protein N7G274_005231 [Stereocaulon virgatum]|uniref:Uncharacterized protein n=1 Tax=Stereocaulon virgatum TaxID=373712 RepID=A0ABR4A8M5_9LECA
MGAADRPLRPKRAPTRYSPEPTSIRPQRKRKPTKSSKPTKTTPKTTPKTISEKFKKPAVPASLPKKAKRGAPKARKTPPPPKKRRPRSFKKAGPRPKKYKTPEAGDGEVSPLTPPRGEGEGVVKRESRSGSK